MNQFEVGTSYSWRPSSVERSLMEQRRWRGETNGELIERSLRETATVQAAPSSVSGDGGAFALYLTKHLADALNGRWQGSRVDTLRAIIAAWLQGEATVPVSDPMVLKAKLLQRFAPENRYPAAKVMAEARLHCSKRQAQVLLQEHLARLYSSSAKQVGEG